MQVRQHLGQQKHKSNFLVVLPFKRGPSDSPAAPHVLSTPALQALGMRGDNTEGYLEVITFYGGSTKQAIQKTNTHQYQKLPKKKAEAEDSSHWVCYCTNFFLKFSSFIEV